MQITIDTELKQANLVEQEQITETAIANDSMKQAAQVNTKKTLPWF
ncbi:hypothetical protein [Nostoc sp. WHI]|nr:hypothetical protein [Nostoc sp. WHI]